MWRGWKRRWFRESNGSCSWRNFGKRREQRQTFARSIITGSDFWRGAHDAFLTLFKLLRNSTHYSKPFGTVQKWSSDDESFRTRPLKGNIAHTTTSHVALQKTCPANDLLEAETLSHRSPNKVKSRKKNLHASEKKYACNCLAMPQSQTPQAMPQSIRIAICLNRSFSCPLLGKTSNLWKSTPWAVKHASTYAL